jgi:hypothetical protein
VTTEKQIIANRENALKGGVKTAEGQAVSRLNALSHGLLSKDLILPHEDGSLLDALRERYLEELQPEGEFETLLVERIISGTWRLKRAVRIEKKYTKEGGDYRFGSWQNLMRYETAIERQIYRARHELGKMQKARSGKSIIVPQDDLSDET